MKRIDETNLQPGDILLTTTLRWESRKIRQGTKSDISHAMLYVSSASVIDSTGDGVQARNLQKLFYDDECAVHALRPKSPLSPAALKQVIDYARAATGTPYSFIEAVRAFKGPRGEGSEKQFCSRLVARAYEEAGVKLVASPDFCTPGQLKASPLLQLLASPAVSVSDDEVEATRSQRDGVAGMIHVTNQFLVMVREVSPKIGSINDALQFLVDNQAYDAVIEEALRASGYLRFWREELEAFPWRYDIDTMLEFERQHGLTSELEDYCRRTLEDDADGTFEHWSAALAASRENVKKFGLSTFQALVTLYENLVASHEQRVTTAREWVSRHGS